MYTLKSDIEVCVKYLVNEDFTEKQVRTYMNKTLPTLDYWRKAAG